MQPLTQETDANRNRIAVTMLKEIGFSMRSIRQALPKLTGVKHQDLAEAAETSRQTITLHLANERGNPRVQRVISEAWGVPVDLLFGDDDQPISDEAA